MTMVINDGNDDKHCKDDNDDNASYGVNDGNDSYGVNACLVAAMQCLVVIVHMSRA